MGTTQKQNKPCILVKLRTRKRQKRSCDLGRATARI